MATTAKEYFETYVLSRLEKGDRNFGVPAIQAGANVEKLRDTIRGMIDTWAKAQGGIPVDIVLSFPKATPFLTRLADTREYKVAPDPGPAA